MTKINIWIVLSLLTLSACGGGFLSLQSVKKYKGLSASEFIEKRFCSSKFESTVKKINAGLDKVNSFGATEAKKRRIKLEDQLYQAKKGTLKSKDSCSKVYYTTATNPYQLYMPYNDVELFCHIKGGRLILIEKGQIGFMDDYLLNPYVMSHNRYNNSRNIKFTTEIMPGLSMDHEITKKDQAMDTFYRTLHHNKAIKKEKESLEKPNQYGYFGKYMCQNRDDYSEIFKILIKPTSWHQEIDRNLGNTKFRLTRILISSDEKHF